MESQNHFYGHSAALAAYAGLPAPRHIAGLVQHGWTAVSPVATHFRDFPNLGRTPGPPRLLVWSHRSRAWEPSAETRATTPIGAQFAYLAAAMTAGPERRDARDAVVLMPVHGIETQRVRGDHGALARLWRDKEGPATACLYAADAKDPEIRDAYVAAGHRVVMLGDRLDPKFLWRLWTMLARADRVVSNRLSTPVVYAGHLGSSIGVYGDALRIDGEAAGGVERVEGLWPELHAERVEPEVAKRLCDLELGVPHLLEPDRLTEVLGWTHRGVRPFVEHWTTSPVQRALINVKRRRSAASVPAAGADEAQSVSGLAWLRAAMTYLPDRLPRSSPSVAQQVEPVLVSGE